MFRRALICTDFSDGLYRLVDFVPSLGASGLEQIVFFHTVPLLESGSIPREDKQKIEKAQSRLGKALENVPDGLEVKIEVLSSNKPQDSIFKAAQTHHSDVIITGANTRSLLNETVFGSTTLSISEQTSIPLMVLRPQLISTYTCEELDLRCRHLFRYIMLAYDDSDSAKYLLDRFKTAAQNRPANSLQECLLIWVIEEGGRRELRSPEQLEQARQKLEKIKQDLEALDLKVQVEVRRGEPLLELLDAALEFDISAIAVSSTRANKLLEWSAPSFSNEVLRRSWHPTLFFSPGKKG
ncbi:universal stress protein [Oscillatoria laete-virens NRMC-F 0139]|nr:universal stress protein [Oscillatoria laete-virens]MDL5052365.1 universal stress protein [Oscillatoria laete-virens NRMC-F 0139]